jgi:hypothetical protein
VPGTTPAERKRAARAAERRREAVTMLQIAECMCRYAAARLGNGADPAEARATALEAAGELVAVADALRRLTRLDPAARRALAVQLAALGWPTRQIAMQLGVDPRCVRYYVAGRRSTGLHGLRAAARAVFAGQPSSLEQAGGVIPL